MTTEEAIKVLEYPVLKWSMDFDERDDGLSYYDAIELAISALRAQQGDENSGALKTTYETPESCPHCMEHLSKDWSFCPECGRPTIWSKNEPLTLDELKKMNGEPVWIVADIGMSQRSFWALVEVCEESIFLTNNLGGRTEYAADVELEADCTMVYRRKLEEGAE